MGSKLWRGLFGGRLLLPALALVGVAGGVAYVIRGQVPAPVSRPVAAPSIAPYRCYIAGSGMLEASTRNISISTPINGLIAEVFVKDGERVEKGQPLFALDTRDLQAQLAAQKSAIVVADDQVIEAKASLAQARNELNMARSLNNPRAISRETLDNDRYTVALDDAKLATAEANVGSAEAHLHEIETNIERATIDAPVTGQILQLNVSPGEYAQTGVLSTPLILLGETRTLHAVVDVDENDAWRFRPDTPAKGFVRGNSAISFDMHFAYVEPYVVPKTQLSGQSTELVDTRVLHVVYSFAKRGLPVYVGQQIDVYIESPCRLTATGEVAPPLPSPLSPSPSSHDRRSRASGTGVAGG